MYVGICFEVASISRICLMYSRVLSLIRSRVLQEPSTITLTLADKSTKNSYEVMEVIVVKEGEAFIKLRDIIDSKEDSLTIRVSMFLEEDMHIFHKIKERSRGTLTSPYQIHGIPS